MARSKKVKRYGGKGHAKARKEAKAEKLAARAAKAPQKKARRRRRSVTTYRKNPSSNPPMFMDLVEFIGPGFAAFAATRMATRVTALQIAKRWPKMAPHAGVAASGASFLAAWLLAHKVKFLERFHTPIVVGAGIALLQTAVQTWIPRLGWMVSDATPEIAVASQQALPATGDDDLIDVTNDEDSWATFNDAHDAGRFDSGYERQNKPAARARPQQQRPAQAKQTSAEDDEDLVGSILEDDNDEIVNVMGGQN
jgi:hypothetical protein